MKSNDLKWWRIIKVLLCVLVLILLVLVGLKLFKGKQLDSNSSLINEIYTYLGQNDLSFCNGLTTYSGEKVDYSSLSNEDRICNTIAQIYTKEDMTLVKIDKAKKNNTCSLNDEVKFATDNYEDDLCSVYRIDKSKVAEKYESIYGKKMDNDETFSLNNTTICYPFEDYYYCGLSETFKVNVGVEPATYRSIKEAIEKKDKIIIYDYFIKIANEECFTSYTSETENSRCTNEYKNNKDVSYDYLKSYGTLYKHTYKKDHNGNYHWVESIPV